MCPNTCRPTSPADREGELVKGFYVLIHDISALDGKPSATGRGLAPAHRLAGNDVQMHAIYSVADRRGNIVDVNDAFCRISGYDREALIGNNHRIINSGVHPEPSGVDMWYTISRVASPGTAKCATALAMAPFIG